MVTTMAMRIGATPIVLSLFLAPPSRPGRIMDVKTGHFSEFFHSSSVRFFWNLGKVIIFEFKKYAKKAIVQ
jgi:hypothetical protein